MLHAVPEDDSLSAVALRVVEGDVTRESVVFTERGNDGVADRLERAFTLLRIGTGE